MKALFRIILPAAAVIAAGLTLSPSPAAAGSVPEASDSLLKMGERVYVRECAACHGTEGDGKGDGAYILNPKPRNFQLGVYKLRSTPNGEPPTLEDVFKTITDGVPGSMMPAFKSLPEDERWALVHHVMRLGELQDEVSTAIAVPKEPEITDARIANGKQLYTKLKCGTCHAVDGMGDGPSSLTLKNDAKERIYPTNLTQGIFKGGAKGTDIYTRIATGLDGSPMPSYAAEAKPDEIWDLVHYLQTLVK